MPIRHAGILAKRTSTWLRDHFWRNTMPPRTSKPTTWNEFLPISIPITVIVLLSLWDMGCSLSLAPLARFVAGGAGARPDHPISGHPSSDDSVDDITRCGRKIAKTGGRRRIARSKTQKSPNHAGPGSL